MRYKTENELLAVVESFEKGTISRDDWKHAEHLTVALYYLSKNDFDAAYKKMRDGIFNLLNAFKVDLSKEMPYHETMTVFWLKTVEEFKESKDGYSMLEVHNEIVEKFDKDYPLKFYSRELLFSDEARERFVDADLVQDSRFKI
jgi:hypothetical protein